MKEDWVSGVSPDLLWGTSQLELETGEIEAYQDQELKLKLKLTSLEAPGADLR